MARAFNFVHFSNLDKQFQIHFSARKRPPIQLSEEQKEYRALLHKDWARYQRQQNYELHRICQNILLSQNKALEELRLESEELYQAAIQPDDNLVTLNIKGPVHTPPIKNYESPAEYRFTRNFASFSVLLQFTN